MPNPPITTPLEHVEGAGIRGPAAQLTAPARVNLMPEKNDSLGTTLGKLGLGILLNVGENQIGNEMMKEGLKGRQDPRIAGMAAFGKALDLSMPAVGPSTCVDIGKILHNTGVTGGVCAGVGMNFKGNSVLGMDKPNFQAGFAARLSF